jgi:hypothetical protein
MRRADENEDFRQGKPRKEFATWLLKAKIKTRCGKADTTAQIAIARGRQNNAG